MPFPRIFSQRRPEDEEDIWNRELPGEYEMPETRSSVDEMLMPNIEPMPGSDQPLQPDPGFLPEQVQPDPMIDPAQMQANQEVEEDPRMLDSLMGSYGNEQQIQHPAFDRYLEEIQNAPRREDYKASTGRRVLGSLAGALESFGGGDGTKLGTDITEGPFKRAQYDFKNRIEPLEKGVGFEKSFTETMRKQMNDQRGYGAKLAKLEGDHAKAKNQLDIAERNASTQEERTRIQQARLDLDRELKNARVEIDRMRAGSDRIRAGAAQTSANAKINNSGAYVENQKRGGKQAHVPVTEQVKAEAVAYQDALDDVMSNPTIKNLFDNLGGVTIDRTKGAPKLVFPEGINTATQEMFKRMHKDAQAKRTKERLGRTY